LDEGKNRVLRGVEVNTNDLVHVQLQPHLYKPPRAIDTCYLLAGVHLGDNLMKHVVYTAQEVFSKGNALTTSQLCSHYNMIQSRLIGFTTEDEPAQPHVQEGHVFDFTKRAIFHVILDIMFISTP
jgi:hypothetical protein